MFETILSIPQNFYVNYICISMYVCVCVHINYANKWFYSSFLSFMAYIYIFVLQ